ncbi:AAA family ATPase [Candidatus Woesearchaeota archaeon]|jgi:archaeal cell division control protein 6|nr:AAA family ATPase [Candidatus Woesearchaeota archaeon]
MSLFKDTLGASESLFRMEQALDYEFLPKLLPYRENEQFRMAACIKPLLQGRTGKNVFIYGAPGIGKTAAMKFVLKELEEESDDVYVIYLNCWQKNTTYKIILEICAQIDYRFTQNKKTEELFRIVKDVLNKKSVVFAFDEIDKVEDLDFLYTIIEEIFKKTIFLITNYKEWLIDADQRVKSRLIPEMIEFKQYNAQETFGILKERLGYAFVPGVWDDDAFVVAANKAGDLKDIRAGLNILRESGLTAENYSSKKITKEHVQETLTKMEEFFVKKPADLEDDMQTILAIIQDHDGKKIGDIYKVYQENGGKAIYKTFQRRIRKLSDNKYITTKTISGGSEGRTTIIHVSKMKKLTEF